MVAPLAPVYTIVEFGAEIALLGATSVLNFPPSPATHEAESSKADYEDGEDGGLAVRHSQPSPHFRLPPSHDSNKMPSRPASQMERRRLPVFVMFLARAAGVYLSALGLNSAAYTRINTY